LMRETNGTYRLRHIGNANNASVKQVQI